MVLGFYRGTRCGDQAVSRENHAAVAISIGLESSSSTTEEGDDADMWVGSVSETWRGVGLSAGEREGKGARVARLGRSGAGLHEKRGGNPHWGSVWRRPSGVRPWETEGVGQQTEREKGVFCFFFSGFFKPFSNE